MMAQMKQLHALLQQGREIDPEMSCNITHAYTSHPVWRVEINDMDEGLTFRNYREAAIHAIKQLSGIIIRTACEKNTRVAAVQS